MTWNDSVPSYSMGFVELSSITNYFSKIEFLIRSDDHCLVVDVMFFTKAGRVTGYGFMCFKDLGVLKRLN